MYFSLLLNQRLEILEIFKGFYENIIELFVPAKTWREQ